MMIRTALSALFITAATTMVSSAQGIDPRGIYFNDFTGSFNGTEWFQVTSNGGSTTSFNIRDIYGGGFLATITANGDIIIPGEPIDGSFSGPDDFVIFPFGGQFTFTSNRVPTTTVDFPLTLDSPQTANPLLAGQWSNTLRFFDPQTGQPGPPGTEVITVTTNGNRVRITDPSGLFFQGIFEDGLNAAFRALNNPSFPNPTGIYAPFPGSITNIGQDLLGEMNMVDINNFRASFLLQTRTPLGNQTQSVVEFVAERLNPLAQGDANGDGVVDAVDEQIVTTLQGATFEDATYNLAADINADGVIDAVDLAFFGPGPIGINYCGTAVPNSSGQSAALAGTGSTNVAANNVSLTATGLALNQFGFFVTSTTQAFVVGPGNSQGNLCVGGAIGRFNNMIQNSGASGSFGITLDLTDIPQPTGSVAIQPGETWSFQAWFRDNNPGSTSNFTDGLSILFD